MKRQLDSKKEVQKAREFARAEIRELPNRGYMAEIAELLQHRHESLAQKIVQDDSSGPLDS